MLIRAEIPLTIPVNLQFNSSWGSLFHGAVMELLPPDLISILHEPGPKPLAQYVYREQNGQVVWVIAALEDRMATEISTVLLNKLPIELKLEQKSSIVRLAEPRRFEQTTYQDLADKHFRSANVNRQHKIRFLTPTSFKTAGKHVIFPTTDLIMNSLMQRWDANSVGLSLYDPDVREHLGKHVAIRDYSLHSASFSVNGSWLKGFAGSLDLSISGPEALARVAGLLIDFGHYSGIGVKTTLGMGGMQIG